MYKGDRKVACICISVHTAIHVIQLLHNQFQNSHGVHLLPWTYQCCLSAFQKLTNRFISNCTLMLFSNFAGVRIMHSNYRILVFKLKNDLHISTNAYVHAHRRSLGYFAMHSRLTPRHVQRDRSIKPPKVSKNCSQRYLMERWLVVNLKNQNTPKSIEISTFYCNAAYTQHAMNTPIFKLSLPHFHKMCPLQSRLQYHVQHIDKKLLSPLEQLVAETAVVQMSKSKQSSTDLTIISSSPAVPVTLLPYFYYANRTHISNV